MAEGITPPPDSPAEIARLRQRVAELEAALASQMHPAGERQHGQERPHPSGAPEPQQAQPRNARFRLLVRAISEYAIFMLDPAGHIVSWNSGAQIIKGYAENEIIGRHFSLFYPPEDIQAGKPAAELEIAARVGHYHEEGWRIRKDGSRFWASVSITALYDQDGSLYGFGKVTRDMSAQQAEEAERQLEKRFRAVAESFDDVVFVLDGEMRYTQMFGGWLSKLGLTPDDVLGKTVRERLGTAAAIHEAAFRRALAGEHVTYEWLAPRPGDEPLIIQTALGPLLDSANAIVGVVGVGRDITLLKQTEAALRESETRYRTAVDVLTEGVLWQAGDGSIKTCNLSAVRILGLTADQLMGRTSLDPRWRTIREDGSRFPGPELPAVVALRTGQAQKHVIMGIHKPDGELTWLEVNAQPLQRPEEDRPYAVVVSFVDLTPYKQAEQALRESEARYRLLAEHSSDLISRHTPEGVYLYASPACRTLLGYRPEELVGRSAYELFHPEDIAAITTSHTTILERPDIYTVAYRIRRSDGLYRWFETTSHTIRDPQSGAVQEILAVSRDITERKRAEEARLELERRLLEAQKMESLGVLAGGVAHDFNNLLQGIIGYTELALGELPPGAALRDTLSPILRLSERAAGLAAQMLAYSGKGNFVVQPVLLAELVTSTLPLLKSIIDHTVNIQLQLDPGTGPIEADSIQIRQVLMNLVVNAAEAIGEQIGTITIRTRLQHISRAYLSTTAPAPDLPEGQYVVLEVADTGMGMDSATQGRIFEPFFTTKFTGRGLGLAAVLGIVRGHGGTIHVQSAPGRGTSICILFPRLNIAKQPPNTQGQPHAAKAVAATRAPAATRTVLIIDDEAAVREVMTRILERDGLSVLSAGDGPAGIATFQLHHDQIDCVILDLMMPGMGGELVARALYQTQPNVRIVIMSGYTAEDTRMRFQEQRIAGFLHKPFQPAELRAVITETLAEFS